MKVTKGKDKVTPAQVSAYYAKNQLAVRQARDPRHRPRADQDLRPGPGALKAVEGGDPFKEVSQKYSVDPAAKQQGGKLTVTKGQQDQTFDNAVFTAPKGKVQGPVKTQFGYLVFQVDKITPATQQTLAQAAPQIRQQLAASGQQKALQSFVKDFEKKWKDRTDCREGYVVQACKNAPKPRSPRSRRRPRPARCPSRARQLRRRRAPRPPRGRPGPLLSAPERTAAAVARLDELTRVLRRECPWDREQDERSIVPHTVEEAYELADAAHHGDDAKLLDELGDVLFQVHFLSLLLEERGAGDLAAVAEHCHAKLVRRHPHVFGEVQVQGAGDVLRNWDRIKEREAGREPGLFGELPANLPGPLYARKVQRRAASSGFDWPDAAAPLDAVEEELRGP